MPSFNSKPSTAPVEYTRYGSTVFTTDGPIVVDLSNVSVRIRDKLS